MKSEKKYKIFIVTGLSGAGRSSALKIARREWDGKTMPPPNTAIYGENAINRAYGSTNSNGGTESYTTPVLQNPTTY